MHIAEVAIRRWQLTLVLFALLSALGFSAFQQVPRAVDPHFSMPVVSIVALQPGADPAEIEQTITKPIEELIQGLEDVQSVASTSTDGSAVIRAEFDWSGDPDQYFNDTVREVTAIRSQLPSDLQRLTFEKIRTTNTSILQIALLSDSASWYRMEKYARDISEALGRYKEVRQTEIYGLPQPEISVAIDAGRLAALRVPASAVADAIRLGGADVPAGAVTSGTRRFNVEAGGAYRDLDTIRNLPLRTSQGTLLRVGDVAEVKYSAAEQRVKVSHNGKRAIWITANQKQGTDATKLRNLLVQELAVQEKLLPPDITAIVQFDQSRDITKRLRELARDFGIALFLVLFTLLPLGWRASIIVMISIPLSIASGLLAISAMGFNLSQLVVAGFILSLGLLVDDSIVVVENIARHLRMGKSRDQAAIDGTREITMAVMGSTGVLVFAFFPLFFLPEGAGKFTQSFIGTIVATITASMIVSLTIVPFLASRILSRDEDEEGNALLRWLMGKIDRFYHPLLHWALDRPRRTVWGALAVTCAAFTLIPVLGFSLFPNADTSYFRVTVEAEQGSSIEETGRIVRQVSEVLKSEPAITVRAENVGAYNPPVFYNVFQRGENPTHGEVLAIMAEWKGAQSRAMVDRLRRKLDLIPGARVKIVLFQNGAPINAPVEFRVYGPEQDELRNIAAKMEQILRDTPGARDINNPVAFDRVDLNVRIDDAKAALLDVPSGAPRRAIRLALSGERSGTFRDSEGDSYPVIVRLPMAETQPVSALESIYVSNRSGQSVQLSEISRPVLESTPAAIYRYNLERNISVTAQISDGAVVSKVNREAQQKMNSIPLKPGYSIEIGGEAEKINDTFAGFGPIVLIAMFSIFAILVAEFGRFKEALVVAGVIPLGTFGGLIALLITGNNLSFLAVIGFIALVGIEIKNSILLVDFTSQLRERGMALREAIERAGEVRFLPVLLTSVTAIGGLMPLALFGGSLYGPLAIVLIGGLISSTLLSRIVTPAMYLLVVRSDENNASMPATDTKEISNAT
ncbi:efflux RND transporter permease subunit [Sphingorhabdus contaminans]|uniref:Efflux RND transporter permease subunit n=1 Tax=Sphingorhabdus contaminans TaxID=1343899 RepID=A0A553WK98_9SPHN|nr:efflux RND transporter permease subunit [Sphingorhabdus contaminans]TSB05086.1 efflux RND transporter permease subunit [Sphingorhabdus contaminans]